VNTFSEGHSQQFAPHPDGGGRDGVDRGLTPAFVEAAYVGSQALLGTNVGEVLRGHPTVFAVGRSRLEDCVVDYTEFEKE
jgi:hypothetical protein